MWKYSVNYANVKLLLFLIYLFWLHGSSLLLLAFLSCGEPRATLQLWLSGSRLRLNSCGCSSLVALRNVGSSWTRDRTHVPGLGRQILNCWTTREGLIKLLLTYVFISSVDKMLVIIYNSKEEWKEKSLQGTFPWKKICVQVLCSYGHAEADKDREFLSWGPWDHSRVNLGYPETPPILSHLKKTFAVVAAV